MMHKSTTTRVWNRFFKAVCFSLIGSVLVFSHGSAWATPKTIPGTVEAYSGYPGGPFPVGGTIHIPVRIITAPKWKSATVRFELDTEYMSKGANPSSVQAEEVQIDTSLSAPFMTHVPVKVTGEGSFPLKGVINVQMADGEKAYNGQSSFVYHFSAGIFSSDGEVFFGGDTSLAAHERVKHSLLTENPEIAELIKKRQKINEGTLEKEALSKEDNEKLRQAFRDEQNRLYKRALERNPQMPQPSSKAINFPLTPGTTVNLMVRWPINAYYDSDNSIPLDGAEITVVNQSNAVLGSGRLSSGRFSFTVPEGGDVIGFTATVTADYGLFSTHNGESSTDPLEIKFKDTDVFDIRPVPASVSNDPFEITNDQANAWSVFQATVEMQALAREQLGVEKRGGYIVYANAGATDFNRDTGNFRVLPGSSFEWDTVAHEFSHAIAHETNSTNRTLGSARHNGSNQYDYDPTNPGDPKLPTYQNKDNSVYLALNEGFTTWLGVSLLEHSRYKGQMQWIGDQTDHNGYSSISLESNAAARYYGEDTGQALHNLL